MPLQVTVKQTECTIIADAANREEIDMRVSQIKKELSETDSTYDTQKLSERIAKLAGGVAVIKVRLSHPAQSLSAAHRGHILVIFITHRLMFIIYIITYYTYYIIIISFIALL